MRKLKSGLLRMALWAGLQNVIYDAVCIIKALCMPGAEDANGKFYTGGEMAVPYVWYLFFHILFFGICALVLRAGIIVRGNDEKGWPKNYEDKFHKREFVYQAILVTVMLQVVLMSRTVYNLVSYGVFIVLVIIERVLFRIIHHDRPKQVKLSRRVKTQRLIQYFAEYLLYAENPRAEGKAGSSDFSNDADDEEEYRPRKRQKKSKEDEEVAKKDDHRSDDDLDDFIKEASKADAGDDDGDFYASFLSSRERDKRHDDGLFDEDDFFND